MKRVLFTFSLTLLASYSMGQEVLSLSRCLQMGIERNLNLKTYEGNALKGKHNISENRSRLLPQINIGAALNDNFTPPVSVTDGSAYGKPYMLLKRCSITRRQVSNCKCRYIVRRLLLPWTFPRHSTKSTIFLTLRQRRT